MLRLEDQWVWDSWLADTGTEYHLFFLQAPRSLGKETLRHFNATVGHAVSDDLRDWRVLPDALAPGSPGTWEDLAIWTGSMARRDGTWHMFYTGTTGSIGDVRQRVGLATSEDLEHWQKHPLNPLIELDARWYEHVEYDAWRDPWVVPDPDGEGYHALITARARVGSPDARGVVGHAWSPDLIEWEVRPPLSEPGEFGHLEVLQVEIVEDRPVLLFSTGVLRIGSARRARFPDEVSSSFLAFGETLLGPWDIAGARPLPVPDLYAARIVRDRAGEWQVMGFYDGSDRGEFRGEISDPIPLRDLGLV